MTSKKKSNRKKREKPDWLRIELWDDTPDIELTGKLKEHYENIKKSLDNSKKNYQENKEAKEKGEDAWIQETEQAKQYGDYLLILEFEKLGYSEKKIADLMYSNINYIKYLKQIFK